jgi:hypothetical protein
MENNYNSQEKETKTDKNKKNKKNKKAKDIIFNEVEPKDKTELHINEKILEFFYSEQNNEIKPSKSELDLLKVNKLYINNKI